MEFDVYWRPAPVWLLLVEIVLSVVLVLLTLWLYRKRNKEQ